MLSKLFKDGIDPKWIMLLGLLINIEKGIGQGALSLTNMVPDSWIPHIVAWNNGLAWGGVMIMTFLAALCSNSPGPLINVPNIPALSVDATKAVAKILIAAFVLSMFLATGSAQAQVRLKSPQEVGADIKGAFTPSQQASTPASGTKLGDSGCKVTGVPVADLHCVLKAGGAKLVLHLKQSYALASAQGAAGGSVTDNTSAMCTKALVPIVELVVNGPKAGTIPAGDAMALTADEQALAANTSEPDGPIVVIEKIRILRLALQSPALNDACGALVQDEVKNGQDITGKITSLVTGAGILAPLGL